MSARSTASATITFGLVAVPSDRAPAGGGMKDAGRAAQAETERRLIRAALDEIGGNVTRAAERLGAWVLTVRFSASAGPASSSVRKSPPSA